MIRNARRTVVRFAPVLALFSSAACSGGNLDATSAREEIEPTSSSAAITSATALVFSGGPIAQPDITPIFWGTFTLQQIADTSAYLGNLASYISGKNSPSGKQPTVSQYGVRGATVNPPVGAGAPLPSAAITDTDIQVMLSNLMASGAIPAPNPHRLNVVFIGSTSFANPYYVTLGLGAENLGAYGSFWCGYHSAMPELVFGDAWYAVVPVTASGTCASPFRVASQEIFDAATNPRRNLGWHDVNGRDASDTCNNDSDQSLGFGPIAKISDNLQVGACNLFSTEQLAETSTVGAGTFGVSTFGYGTSREVVFAALLGSTNLGGTFLSPPVALGGVGGSGTFNVFAQGDDNAFYQKWWNGSGWAPSWQRLTATAAGGRFIGQPAVVSWGANRLDVFGMGIDGHYYHTANTAWPPTSPSSWTSLDLVGGATFVGQPTVVSRGISSIDIFGRKTNGTYARFAWNGTLPFAGTWEPLPISGAYTEPTVIATSSRLGVLGQVSNGSYQFAEWSNGSGWSSPLTLIGNYMSPPAAVYRYGTTDIDVVGQGTDGKYYLQQRINGSWQSLQSVNNGHGFGAATLFAAPGGTVVTIDGDDHGVYYNTITGTGPSGWTGPLGVNTLH